MLVAHSAWRTGALIALAATLPAALVVPALEQPALYLAPALLLLSLLLRGRFVGERQIARLRTALDRRRARRRAVRTVPSTGLPRPARVLPRGGWLIATALAVRPPPAFVTR